MKNTAPLSYSSAQLLNNCEQRYWHYKVNATPHDSDYDEDKKAFNVGKTFHEVLEFNNHTDEKVQELLKDACKKYGTEDEKLMIFAMLTKYLELHQLSGLKCIACELQINSDEVIGFIDAIMVDEQGYWYICDLKTAGMWKESKLNELASDYQLNLYASFAERMAGVLELDADKFKGCLYRVTTKSKLKQGGSESDQAYYKRLLKSVKSIDVFIPKENLRVEKIWERHLENYNRSTELRNGEAPTRNFSYCMSFFSPCPYWSQCHGDINSECDNKVIMNTAETFREFNKAVNSL